MILLTKQELEVFYKLDAKVYIVKCNKTLKSILSQLDYKYNLDDIQIFIDKIISWYWVKFPDKFIKNVINSKKDTTVIKKMDIIELEKRFDTIEISLINCKDTDTAFFIKYLIMMAGFGLIYDKNTKPEYGYFRAKRMLADFSQHYGLNLDIRIYDDVMKRDYSSNNPEIISLLLEKKKIEKKKQEDTKKKKKTRKRVRNLFQR